MSDEEHSEAEESGDEGPSEAELALKKRRDVGRQVSASGLDEASKELLETNRQDRERMEDEIQELRKRTLKRKKEREVEEKRLAAERAAEEERRKAAEDEKRKKKEEEDLERKRKRDSKKAEFEKVTNKPNFVISKRSDDGGAAEEEGEGQGKKSREQLEKEKRAILKQRIQELKTDGLDQSGLQEKARELHKLIHRLEGEKYDLEKRYKTQQVEMMELAERARQANRVGREGIKRVVLGDGENDKIQERFAGAPAKIEMFSKYERQKDKRDYNERKTCYVGPSYVPPPERIKPTKIVKWSAEGLPQYEEIPGAEGAGEEHGGH